MISTGGTGYNVGCGYPGAAWPLGRVRPSPDTSNYEGAAFAAYHGGGYHYDDTHIQGFSQVHLHGVGLTDYGLVSLMPTDSMSAEKTNEDGYRAPFDHADESAVAGRYDVNLTSPDIQVSLAAEPHVAHHRYAFGTSVSDPTLILDLGHRMDGSSVRLADLTIDPATGRVEGSLHQDGAMAARPFTIWFAMDLSVLPADWGTFSRDGVLEPQSTAAQADAEEQGVESVRAGAWFSFDTPTVDAKVAISFTDAEGARNALNAALYADVDEAAVGGNEAWTDTFSPVRVWGGTTDEQVIFASALYHSLLLPTLLSDPDGRYRGFDDAVHENPGHLYFSDFSLWDTYRTTHPLYTLLWPDQHADMLRSFARMVEQGGGIPRWPLATWDPGFMVGSPGHIVVAEAIVKGIDLGNDRDLLLENARDVALGRLSPPYGGRPDPVQYGALGYWPSDDAGRMVAWQLEVALADYALARALESVDAAPEDASELARRADFWRNVYNPETGFMQGRLADGSWRDLPSESSWDDVYTEGNARQYVWMVPHDPEGLFAEMGGNAAAIARLEPFFDNAVVDAADSVIGVPEVWYWHGNEIDLHAPFLAALAGRPDLTRRYVDWVLHTWYSTAHNGLAGNDDGGTLSAWAVWASIGFYPLAGTERYVLGWPIFDRIEVDRADGGTLVVTRSGDGLAEGAHVTIWVDGEAWTAPDISHDVLAHATTLRFEASL